MQGHNRTSSNIFSNSEESLEKLKKDLQETQESIGCEKIGTAVLLLGVTGCGKTTLMNIILDNQLLGVKSESGGISLNQYDENRSKLPKMIIGNSVAKSETKITNKAFSEALNISFLDLAGYLDTNDYQDIINCFARKKIFELCDRVSFIYVLDEPSFKAQKAVSAKGSLRSFLMNFKDSKSLKKVLDANALSIVLSKSNNMKDLENLNKTLNEIAMAFKLQGELIPPGLNELCDYLKTKGSSKVFFWEEVKMDGPYERPKFVNEMLNTIQYSDIQLTDFDFKLGENSAKHLDKLLKDYLSKSNIMFGCQDPKRIRNDGDRLNKDLTNKENQGNLDKIMDFFDNDYYCLRSVDSATLDILKDENFNLDSDSGTLTHKYMFIIECIHLLIDEYKRLSSEKVLMKWLTILKERAPFIASVLSQFKDPQFESKNLANVFINHADLLKYFFYMIKDEKREDSKYSQTFANNIKVLEEILTSRIQILCSLIGVPGCFKDPKEEEGAKEKLGDLNILLPKQQISWLSDGQEEWSLYETIKKFFEQKCKYPENLSKFTKNLISLNCHYHFGILATRRNDHKTAVFHFIKALEITYDKAPSDKKSIGYPVSKLYGVLNGILSENPDLIQLLRDSERFKDILKKLFSSNFNSVDKYLKNLNDKTKLFFEKGSDSTIIPTIENLDKLSVLLNIFEDIPSSKGNFIDLILRALEIIDNENMKNNTRTFKYLLVLNEMSGETFNADLEKLKDPNYYSMPLIKHLSKLVLINLNLKNIMDHNSSKSKCYEFYEPLLQKLKMYMDKDYLNVDEDKLVQDPNKGGCELKIEDLARTKVLVYYYMGQIYYKHQRKYEMARLFYLQSLRLYRKIPDKEGLETIKKIYTKYARLFFEDVEDKDEWKRKTWADQMTPDIMFEFLDMGVQDIKSVIGNRFQILIKDFFGGSDSYDSIPAAKKHPLKMYSKRDYFLFRVEEDQLSDIKFIKDMGLIEEGIDKVSQYKKLGEKHKNFKTSFPEMLNILDETIDKYELERFLLDIKKKKQRIPCEKILGSIEKAGLGFIVEQYKYIENMIAILRAENKKKCEEIMNSIFTSFDPFDYKEYYFIQIASLVIREFNQIDSSNLALLDYYPIVEEIIMKALGKLNDIKDSKEEFNRLKLLRDKILKERWDIYFYQKHIDSNIKRAELKRVDQNGNQIDVTHILDPESRLNLYKKAEKLDDELRELSLREKVSNIYGNITKRREILYSKGTILYSLDNFMEAAEAYKEIRYIKEMESAFERLECEKNNNFIALLHIAKIYGELGMLESCIRAYDLCLRLAPLNLESHIKIYTERADSMNLFSEKLVDQCKRKIEYIENFGILY